MAARSKFFILWWVVSHCSIIAFLIPSKGGRKGIRGQATVPVVVASAKPVGSSINITQ
jgi:hypothetical protein